VDGGCISIPLIATIAVPVVIVVYMLVSIGCIRHYLTERRSEFNPLLHLVLPVAGIVLFFFPLYYQFYKAPPAYPSKYAHWVAAAWTILGVLLAVYLSVARREKLAHLDRVYVDDDTMTPAPQSGAAPAL
jgi:amino acid transporter